MTASDRGLQPERTALAWRRAALAFVGTSLLLARVAANSSGVLAVVVGFAGVAGALAILVAVEFRYRSHRRRLRAAADGRAPLAGGGVPLLVGAATTLLALAAGVAVTASALLK